MGEPLVEQLQREGLPVRGFQTTNASKAIKVRKLAMQNHRMIFPSVLSMDFKTFMFISPIILASECRGPTRTMWECR